MGSFTRFTCRLDGGSYTGEAELFCSAPALQVTDMIVNPTDGGLYFAIGGRRTQSALYRIVAKEPTTDAADPVPLTDLQKLRRKVEALHLSDDPASIDEAWPLLSHPDRSIRYAARIAIERQDENLWAERALMEKSPQALLEAMMALARCATGYQSECVNALRQLDWKSLTRDQRLHLIRNYGLVLMRLGEPSPAILDLINEASFTALPDWQCPGKPRVVSPVNGHTC